MKVAITGGREYHLTFPHRGEVIAVWIRHCLDADELHHGAARGADTEVSHYLHRMIGVRLVPHPALWDLHGRSAGFIRNREMVDEVDALIAFPGGRGTAHAVECANKRGIPVYYIGEVKPHDKAI